MRVIIEVENDIELHKVETFLLGLPDAHVKIERTSSVAGRGRLRKLQRFAARYPLTVKRLEIPSRDARNAR